MAFLDDGVVRLDPIAREDLPLLMAWRNTPALRVRTREWRPLNAEDQARWFERITDPHRVDHMFLIFFNGQKVGVVGLCGWRVNDRNAEISFYIGDEQYQRKGLTTRALRLLIAWGFANGLHRIWAEVYAFNVPALNLLKKLGFRAEGLMRDHVFREGAFADAHILGLLAGDELRE